MKYLILLKPYIALAIIVFLLALLIKFYFRRRRRLKKMREKLTFQKTPESSFSSKHISPPVWGQTPTQQIAEEQLRAAQLGNYRKKRLMNKGEWRVFAQIERVARRNDCRTFAQVSLGEIVYAEDDAYGAINAKRVDILVIDRNGFAIFAAEVQGSGHYQGTAVLRDEIKRTALESAGVLFVEFNGEETSDEIIKRINPLLVDFKRPNQSADYSTKIQ